MNNACSTVEELQRLWKSEMFRADYDKIKPDWQAMLIEHFREHKQLLVDRPPQNGTVAPNFDDLPQ